jgi:MoaA/NifB/PqqE/SkfB family radical SAM enzyme
MRFNTIIQTAKAIVGRSRPVILYHKPTERCDCRCRFCDVWLHQPEEEDVLPSEKIFSLLDRAHAAGMSMYTVWGGEPLLVRDLPEWLHRAWDLGIRTVVCTSGGLLAERAHAIGPYTERLLLSLEAIGQKHDRIRGTTGLFKRVLAGLREFKRFGAGEVTLWSNLNRENQDQVEEITRFASDEGITVEFFPAAKHPQYNEKILLDPTEITEVFGRVMDLKRRGFPVLNTWHSLELMRSQRPFRCNIPRLSVQVCADGSVYACDPKMLQDLSPYGDIETVNLKKLSSSDTYRKSWQGLRSCNRCMLPCVANNADALLPQALRKMANRFFYYHLFRYSQGFFKYVRK